MKAISRCALLAACLILTPAAALAECAIGTAPQVPNGAQANKDEMAAAQAAMKAYIVETQEFLTCLEGEARGTFTPEITARYNEATERMSGLALAMNAQLRAFKERG